MAAASSTVSTQLNQEIERTQQVLNYVRRPPLSVKLLSKPPFKYIHDLVTEVMKTLEGTPRRIFTEQELDKNAFTTKEQKIAYLEKLTTWTSYLVGSRLEVSVKSILTGREPEKTNKLLQAIGRATKIAEGEPGRGIEAADYANGKGTPIRARSRSRGTTDVRRLDPTRTPSRSPRPPSGGAFEDEEENAGIRIIEDKPNTAREDEFQIVDVADGKVTTKQMNTRGRLKNAKNVDEFEEHGVLVRKILEMKRGIDEMERRGQDTGPPPSPSSAAAPEEPGTSMASLDRQQRERDEIRFRREMADLRRKIQTLAACVVPMGREMDEVQIAVDVMLQEHAQWRDENAFLRERLVQERTASHASLVPLTTKLRILQADIDDKVEEIRSRKRTIQFNDDRIRRILNKGLQMGKEPN